MKCALKCARYLTWEADVVERARFLLSSLYFLNFFVLYWKVDTNY